MSVAGQVVLGGAFGVGLPLVLAARQFLALRRRRGDQGDGGLPQDVRPPPPPAGMPAQKRLPACLVPQLAPPRAAPERLRELV